MPSWSTPVYSPDRSLVWPNSFYYLRTDSGGANLPGVVTAALTNTAAYHAGLPNGELFRFEPFSTDDWDYSGSTFPSPLVTAGYFHEVWPGGATTPTTWSISYPQGSTGTSHLYFANLRQENSYKGFLSGAYTPQGNGGYDRHAVLWAESVAYGRQLMEAYGYNGVSPTATQAVTYDLTTYTLPMGTTEPAGVVAGRLPVAPFQFTYADLVAAGTGDLGHMIGWVAANYANDYKWPARADDGELAAANYLKAGSVIRLSSSWTIPAGWPETLKALARTLQRYGAVLFDKNSTLVDPSTGKAVISTVSDPSWPTGAGRLTNLWSASGPDLSDFEEVDITPLKVADGSIEISSAPPPVGPTAAFTRSPASGTSPLSVAFDGTSSTPGDSPIVSYAWTFGDTTTGTGSTTSHTYTTGTYSASLTVTDGNGLTDTSPTQTITVSDAPPPVDCDAMFEWNPDPGSALNLEVLTPSATITLDTASLTAGDPMFIWSRARDNAAGGAGTVTLNGPPGWTQIGTTQHVVDSANHDHALAMWWKPYVVGDTTAVVSYSGAASAYAIAVQTSYVRDAGTSAVAITAGPQTNTGAISATYTAPPFAITDSEQVFHLASACQASNAPSGSRPTVTSAQGFTNIQGQANFQVQVFDKRVITPTATSVTMPSLALPATIFEPTSPWLSITFGLTCCPEPPVASFTASPTSGLVNLSVNFTDTSTAGTFPIVSWAWDFGDGGTSTLQNPTHTYTAGGTYNVTLTVTDSEGFTDTSAPTTITADEPVCSITLTSGPTSPFAPSTIGIDVDLSDFSTGSWSWDLDWGDGTFITIDPLVPGVIPLTHTYTAGIGPTSIVVRVYTEPGHAQYTTCLLEVPIYSPCDITPVSTAEIYAEFPDLPPNVCVGGLGFTVGGFYDYTITFVWGDGTSETIPLSGAVTGQQAHIYPGPGTYNVTFTQTIGDDVQVCGPVEVVVDCPEPPGPCPALLCSPTITWVDSSYDGFLGGNPLTLGPSSFRVDYEDSLNCGGTNENIQLGFAIGTVTAPEATTLGVQLAGQVEWENFGFDQVTVYVQRPTDLGYVLVGSCISRELGQGCVMGAPQLLSIGEAASCYSDDLLFGVDIPVGTTTIRVDFSTNDGRYHQGAWETATFTTACECPPPVPPIPDTNCLPGATLGTGNDLRVYLVNRGATLTLAELEPTTGFFTRSLDQTSELEVTGVITGLLDETCCDGWNEVYPWVTEVLVYRDGRDAWSGPVTDVEFGYGTVTVRAADLTAWWDRRVVPDLSFTGADLSDIFTAVHDAAMAVDPVPNFVVSATPTGIFGARRYIGSEYQYAKDALEELSKTGIDWTCYGRTVLIGGEEVPADPYFTLTDDFWTQPPTVATRGNEQATKVIVRGKGVTGVATADASYLSAYGTLVRVFDEQDIEDAASVSAAARSRLALLQDQTYIETPSGATLTPTAPITLAELIPGIRVRVSAQATCRPIMGDFRLKQVKVDFNGSVSIDLQPLGTDPTNPRPEYAKMVVIGDSLSAWSAAAATAAGKGEPASLSPSNRWQDLLVSDGLVGFSLNGATPGLTTRSALSSPVVPPQPCDLLVIYLGANDMVQQDRTFPPGPFVPDPLSWVLPPEYKTNLIALLDAYPHDEAVLVFPWKWNVNLVDSAWDTNTSAANRMAPYRSAAAQAADARGAKFVDLSQIYNAPSLSQNPIPPYLIDALIHASDSGHRGVADAIKGVL